MVATPDCRGAVRSVVKRRNGTPESRIINGAPNWKKWCAKNVLEFVQKNAIL